MAYRFSAEETIHVNLLRMTRELLAEVRAELADDALDRHEAVHAVRKRGKKLRALLGLSRGALGADFRPADRAVRDAARLLSALRDAHSRVEACDALASDFPAPSDQTVLAAVRARLATRRDEHDATPLALASGTARALTAFDDVLEHVDAWQLGRSGFRALGPGLRFTYERARATMERAFASDTAEHFHDWRKHAKQHSHHLRLLTGAWPELLGPSEAAAAALAQRLGDDHDLLLIEELLASEPAVLGSPDEIAALVERLTDRRRGLRREAHALGTRLFAEEPAAFIERLHAYWLTWRRETRGFRARP